MMTGLMAVIPWIASALSASSLPLLATTPKPQTLKALNPCPTAWIGLVRFIRSKLGPLGPSACPGCLPFAGPRQGPLFASSDSTLDGVNPGFLQGLLTTQSLLAVFLALEFASCALHNHPKHTTCVQPPSLAI